MKMNRNVVFCFFLLLFSTQNGFAQKTDNTVFVPNQKVYVFSFNALNLRDSTNSKSKIIKTLAFGDTVEVIEITNILCPVAEIFKKDTAKLKENEYNQNPINDNLSLQGNWVKVKHRNETGYVNAIYLSALPHFANLSNKWGENLTYKPNSNDYGAMDNQTFLLLNKQYGLSTTSAELSQKALFYKVVKIKKNAEVKKSFRKTYKDGLAFLYEDSYYDEGVGGYTITIKMKGISFAEAIMFCRAFFFNNNPEFKRPIGFYKEDKKFVITSYGEGGGCTGEVFKDKNGDWVVTYGCGGC